MKKFSKIIVTLIFTEIFLNFELKVSLIVNKKHFINVSGKILKMQYSASLNARKTYLQFMFSVQISLKTKSIELISLSIKKEKT